MERTEAPTVGVIRPPCHASSPPEFVLREDCTGDAKLRIMLGLPVTTKSRLAHLNDLVLDYEGASGESDINSSATNISTRVKNQDLHEDCGKDSNFLKQHFLKHAWGAFTAVTKTIYGFRTSFATRFCLPLFDGESLLYAPPSCIWRGDQVIMGSPSGGRGVTTPHIALWGIFVEQGATHCQTKLYHEGNPPVVSRRQADSGRCKVIDFFPTSPGRHPECSLDEGCHNRQLVQSRMGAQPLFHFVLRRSRKQQLTIFVTHEVKRPHFRMWLCTSSLMSDRKLKDRLH
ncbi:hypothetical protein C8R45DRAFT_1026858 [Mycena sanguinolenta]|nr:hypothetical protein C8R45DRAFT_1026858 [Mycena sanguinolenta]